MASTAKIHVEVGDDVVDVEMEVISWIDALKVIYEIIAALKQEANDGK